MMKSLPQNGFSTPKSGMLGIVVQILILVSLLVSTAIVTRTIVLGGDRRYSTVEFQRAAASPVCASGLSPNIHSTSYESTLDQTFETHGYIISAADEKYESASTILTTFGITPHRYEPLPYQSRTVSNAMEKFYHSKEYHGNKQNLKAFAKRMAHTEVLHSFVIDQTAKINSWRFFFDANIAIHPNVTTPMAKDLLAEGLKLGSADGIIYFGFCGPVDSSAETKTLGYGVIANRTISTCTHAYAVTKWRAAGILSHLDNLKLSEDLDPIPQEGLPVYDLLMQSYASTVTIPWVLGVNFRAPVPGEDYFGLIYQESLQ